MFQELDRLYTGQLRPTGTPENSDTKVPSEISIISQEVNSDEDNEENTAQLLDNESNHTETQNANQAQSANDGDENTEESDEIQLD